MQAFDMLSKLNIPSETLEVLHSTPLPCQHSQLKQLFFTQPKAFHHFASANLSGLEILKLYLLWLEDTKAKYDALGIPESYFWDSCKDISIWCQDHLQRFGTPDFIEWGWVGKTLRMEVIRIGRLQFEPALLDQILNLPEQTVPAGTPILHVHIPAGEPLDPDAVLASMRQAPAFFRTYFGREFTLFHCHSWLLSPDLKALIPKSSRIMKFQNLFHVYGADSERQAEERVFGFLSEDPSTYPENTSLQCAVKQHLLRGNAVNMGVGIRLIP